MSKNKTNKRIFATSVTAAVVASAVAPIASLAATTGFPDVPASHNYAGVIKDLVDAGVVTGFPNGEFRPEVQVTRAQASVMVAKILDLPKAEKSAPFPDVKQNYWYTDAIDSLYASGNIKGLDDGKFAPDKTMTRAEFAQLVYAAYEIEKTTEEAPFADLKSEWYKEPINALYANGLIKGVDGKNFAPQNNIKRGDFAWLLANADYAFGKTLPKPSDLTEDVESIKAINATTVEVTFTEEIGEVAASDFKIEGLTVSNAVTKQKDDHTVVLTTSVQEGGKKYTLQYGSNTAGTFEGISAVIPASIKLSTASVQGVVGEQVTLKADIGEKTKNVPVTFNVDGDNNRLNEDIVVEVLTDANGIATFTYTQYNANSVDHVFVYPTGAPAKRDQGYVYWGVSQSLTLVADDAKGNSLNNGEGKVYKVTYLDPKDGKPVANKELNVTFAENVNVAVDKISTATVNGKTPYQLSNRDDVEAVTIKTNSKGEASFTVSGTNTKATPIVFDNSVESSKNKLDADERQVSAEQVVFGAVQTSHVIAVTRDGGEEAAIGDANGRKYKIAVKGKDGKAASGEIVNVAFNEDLDRVISTNTDASIRDDKDYAGDILSGDGTKQAAIKLDSKGEAEFRVTSDGEKDYATPIVWIDINSSDAKDGKLDEGEPNLVADKTYFATPKLTAGSVKAYSDATLTTEVKNDKEFKGTDVAYFGYKYTNQSGEEFTATGVTLKTSFTVFNTGNSEVEVLDGAKWTTVSPNRSLTVTATEAVSPSVQVRSIGGKTSTVRVEGTATSVHATDSKLNGVYLGKFSQTAKFQATADVANEYTGKVINVNTKDEEITFDGKLPIKYKDATSFEYGGTKITKADFEKLVSSNSNNIVKALKNTDTDKYSEFTILSLTDGGSLVNTDPVVTTPVELNAAIGNAQVKSITLGADITANASFTRAVDINLGGKKLTGNVSINHATATNSSISNGTIDGTLTIDTANADFVNSATVTGTTTITNVKANTFVNNGTLAAVVITDADGTSFANKGTAGQVEVNSNGAVTLTGTVLNVLISNANAKVVLPADAVVKVAPGIATADIKITQGDKVLTATEVANLVEGAAAAQATVNAEALTITNTSFVQPLQGVTQLVLPTVAGSTVAVKSSDNEVVITKAGVITPQVAETTVNVVFTVSKTVAGTVYTADTASIEVVVPAATPQQN